jgi:replication factor A1
MKVSELKSGQGKVDVEVVVKSMAEPRVMNKYGKDLKVCNAQVSDESGEIKLTLWNDDVDKVKVGSKIKITNGYVSEFNGEKQLTSGKFGKLEVLGSVSSGKEGDGAKSGEPRASSKKGKEKPEAEPSEDEDFDSDDFDEDDAAF